MISFCSLLMFVHLIFIDGEGDRLSIEPLCEKLTISTYVLWKGVFPLGSNPLAKKMKKRVVARSTFGSYPKFFMVGHPWCVVLRIVQISMAEICALRSTACIPYRTPSNLLPLMGGGV
jgi:hypothetical protein